MTAAEMWDQYGGIGKYSAWQFGGGAECLAELVKSGKKHATSSALAVYEAENAPLPKTGDHSVILDSSDNAVCIIRTTHVTVVRFSDVSEEHARKEGEGDSTLHDWRKVHRVFFEKELRAIGKIFAEDMAVVCEEFELVFKR